MTSSPRFLASTSNARVIVAPSTIDRAWHLATVLAVALAAAGCAAPIESGSDGDPDREQVGAAAEALTVFKQDTLINGSNTTVSIPNSHATLISHEIDGIQNQFLTLQGVGQFPQFQGPLTSARLSGCQAAFIDVNIQKRTAPGLPWVHVEGHKVMASPTIVFDQSTFTFNITSCTAGFGFGPCAPFQLTDASEMLLQTDTNGSVAGVLSDSVSNDTSASCP